MADEQGDPREQMMLECRTARSGVPRLLRWLEHELRAVMPNADPGALREQEGRRILAREILILFCEDVASGSGSPEHHGSGSASSIAAFRQRGARRRIPIRSDD